MLPEQVTCRQCQDVVLVDETRRQCPLGVAREVSQVNKSIARMRLVTFPTPGFPNISILSMFPFPLLSSLACKPVVFSENGSALRVCAK